MGREGREGARTANRSRRPLSERINARLADRHRPLRRNGECEVALVSERLALQRVIPKDEKRPVRSTVSAHSYPTAAMVARKDDDDIPIPTPHIPLLNLTSRHLRHIVRRCGHRATVILLACRVVDEQDVGCAAWLASTIHANNQQSHLATRQHPHSLREENQLTPQTSSPPERAPHSSDQGSNSHHPGNPRRKPCTHHRHQRQCSRRSGA